MSFTSSENCDRPGEGPAGRRVRAFLIDRHFFRQAPNGTRAGVAVIWFAFLVFPLISAIGEHGTALQDGLTIAGAALFIAA